MKESERNYYQNQPQQVQLQQQIQNQNLANQNKSSRMRTGTSFMERSRLENKERDLTPSRIINSSKSIRLSNQVVVATTSETNANNIKIERVPVYTLKDEARKLTTEI